MSNEKTKPAATTAVAKAPETAALAKKATVDDVLALLNPAEDTSDNNAKHEDRGFSGSTPYIGYRSNKAKSKIDEMNAAGVAENAFYLYDLGMIAPKPFYIHLIASYQFCSQTDDDNNILDVSSYLDTDLRKQKFAEHIIGLALVRLPGDLPMFTAATFSQRTGMVHAFDDIKTVIGGLHKDKTGREFASRGPKAKEAVEKAKWPQFAARAKIWGSLEQPSKPGGRTYNKGWSSIEPTPALDIAALNRYMGFEPESYPGENKKDTAFASALESFGRRRAELREKITAKEGVK